MNKRVQFIKKSFINICQKLVNSNNNATNGILKRKHISPSTSETSITNQQKQAEPIQVQFKRQNIYEKASKTNNNNNNNNNAKRKIKSKLNKKVQLKKKQQQQYATSSTSGVSSDYYSKISNENKLPQSSSSGYTSAADDIIYEKQQKAYEKREIKKAKINSTIDDNDEDESKLVKYNIIKYLLDHQIMYIDMLKNGLENYIRPLMAIMNNQLYFQTFINIEKLFTMTQFIRNTIIQSIELTSDLYESAINVIHEYISIIKSTYEIYLDGYIQSCNHLNNPQVIDFIQNLNYNYNTEFNLSEFIDLPLANLIKIYCTFNALLDMHQNEYDVYERINKIYTSMNELINKDGLIIDDLLSTTATNMNNSIMVTLATSNNNKSRQLLNTSVSTALTKYSVSSTASSIIAAGIAIATASRKKSIYKCDFNLNDLKYDCIKPTKTTTPASSRNAYKRNGHKRQVKLQKRVITGKLYDYMDLNGNKHYIV